MKNIFLKIFDLLYLYGFNVRQMAVSVKNTPYFIKTLIMYRRRNAAGSFPVSFKKIYPVLYEMDSEAGDGRSHYFWQDLWVAKKIYARKPKRHLDIGSRLDGFITHLLVFMPVQVLDIRNCTSDIPGLAYIQADATHLENIKSDSVESISALHSIEHFGLGRYRDPVDPDACFKAMRSLARVLKKNGRLYFSVPVGVERLFFNAHRVFSPRTIVNAFRDLSLVSFAAVDDNGRFYPDARIDDFTTQGYGCGIFEFTKK